MKIILEGIVGSEITARQLRNRLRTAGGKPVTIELSSYGGSVVEGIHIYNELRKYGGKITIQIQAIAASMASYIAMAADELVVYDNSVFMIHNPWTITAGDQNDLRKQADILEAMAELTANRYSIRSGQSIEDIRSAMDSETWLFGSEIVDAGYADKLIEEETKQDKDEAIAQARAKFAKIVRIDDDVTAVAAELQACGMGCTLPKPDNKGETMDYSEITASALSANAPAVVDEIKNEAIKAERERISAIVALDTLGLDEKKADEIKREAIANGASVADTIMSIHSALSEQVKAEAEAAAQVAAGVVADGVALGQTAGAINTTVTDGQVDDEKKAAEKMAKMRAEHMSRKGL